ncbi:hypothetical protein [Neobacillus bataviensis]|nr:hypothetical protein [Neobacillus bataviensis]
MNFIKKLIGKEASKSSGCCGVEIKEVEDAQEESCCGTTNETQSSCC